MAKTRSATESKGGISSSSRGYVNAVTNKVVKKSSRSSTNTASSRSMKGSLKSTRVPSKRSQVKRGDCKEKPTNRPSLGRRKRNLSLEELNESIANKKAKVCSSEQLKEDLNDQAKEDERHCSLRGNAKKAGHSKHTHNQKKDEENLAQQTNPMKHEPIKRTEVKKKSPLKCTHETTPENPQTSPRKDKHAQKKLDLDILESAGEQSLTMKDAVTERSSSEESSDDEAVAWEDVDEARVADHVLEAVHKDGHEPSTSQKQHSPSKKSVEISITMPGSKKKKKGWDQEEFLKYVKRAVNRYRKEVRTDVHKVHLLTLVAHGVFRNGICNEPMLQGVLLSHVPIEFVSGGKRKWDVARLTSLLKWFHSKFSSIDDARTVEKQIDEQIPKLGNLSEVLVAILRALGLLTRLLYSMQPVSVKDDVEAKSSKKNQKKMPKGNTPSKTISEENLSTSGQAKKEKAAVNKKDVKKENEVRIVKASAKKPGGGKDVKVKSEVKSPVRKSLVSVAENKIDDAKQNEGKVKKCVENENKKLNKAKHSPKTPKGKGQVNTSREELKDARRGNIIEKKNKSSRPLRKRRKVDYSLNDNESEIEDDEDWNDQSNDSDNEEESNETKTTKESSKSRGTTPLARKKRSTESDSASPSGDSSVLFVDLVDNDSDFEVTSKPLARRRQSFGSSKCKKKTVKIISSDESDDTVTYLGGGSNEQDSNWWAEVYLPAEKKWTCVHLESSSINHPDLCEKQATQPLIYVVAFDNKNSIKDVTNRYASSWMSKTRKLRIDAEWWEDTLRPYKSKNKKMDEMEDSHIEDKLLEKPLPTSIVEFKNHPLYVLKRHLLKFEAIYPETAAILGYCRGEAVFSRECVHTLHTREKWLNEALVVKQGEKAYKVVKGRPKRNQPIHERDSVTIDLFGRWQTEQYKPPPAKDGKVPRNEYGNVELFLPCMLPPGTKHIQINGIQRIAKKLGIDCAQAVVGFDFHCGFSHPVTDGVVVCEEFEQVLLDAWREEEEQAEKRKAEKREKRMLANWRLLTRSLLIRERLKKRYDTEEPKVAESSNNAEGEAVMDTSVSWPLNRQEGKSSVASDGHCHVFPESGHKKDSVTGEWTKSCSCGLTLPFEKM